MVVPLLAWYFLINIGCGTGNKPTRIQCWRNLPKINNSPEIVSEPHGGATIGLVLPDQYWMWYWQQAHQGTMLEELTKDK